MKNVWAWLRMFQPNTDIPTSEGRYLANLANIDAALPTNGGLLMPDGSWEQESWKLSPDWPQSVKAVAHANGQLYLPTVGFKNRDPSILDTPELWGAAADGLLALALTDRFDSPWDGVFLDFEGIPSAQKDALSQFLYLLSYKIRSAGLICAVSVRGRTDEVVDYDNAYSYDFSVMAQVADVVDLRCYGYWNPTGGDLINRSMAPYWWVRECIEYALDQGIPPQRFLLGLGNYCRHYPNSNAQSGVGDISYQKAMELSQDAQAPIEWIERNQLGLVRERRADLGSSHIWIHDGDTFRHGLDLIDQYNLMGISHFVAGMGDEYHWQVIQEWRGG